MKNLDFKIKFKDKSIKDHWKDFCVKLLLRIDEIEKETDEIISHSRSNTTYLERQIFRDKLNRCKIYREKIKKSIKEKEFVLRTCDMELIEEKGFDYYFRYKDGKI